MGVPASHLNYFWQTLAYPRLGLDYDWGGSLERGDVNQGTDCSGWVSAALSALVRGPDMIYTRQFWTGTFAGLNPGDTGPVEGVTDTTNLVCIDHPTSAPPDAVMIIAIIQTGTDTSLAANAHTICSVRGVVTEMGGGPNNLHTGFEPNSTQIDDPEFDQFFYLPGPVILDVPDWTSPQLLSALSRTFAA